MPLLTKPAIYQSGVAYIFPQSLCALCFGAQFQIIPGKLLRRLQLDMRTRHTAGSLPYNNDFLVLPSPIFVLYFEPLGLWGSSKFWREE